ncbi:MAG: putative membrane protein YphA (DoxX/SURF4 family) [Limisphaerales bacterium]|jgi:uncharacterized membrane protein YphA (DoxX/SURF4 family)
MDIINANLPIALCCVFNAILFLQSGLDKVFNYSGNLEYLKEHFSKSPLASLVSLLMPVITLLEVVAGLCCVIGTVQLFFSGDLMFAQLGLALSALSLILLFFGQRLANDYDGASTLVGYFMVALFGLFMAV